MNPIPQGYKQTEIGVIPEDWECLDFSDVFSFRQGIQVPLEKQSLINSNDRVRFIRIIDLTDPQEIPRFILNPGEKYIVKKSDLFMVRYGVPGLIGFNYEGVIANNLFRLIPRTSCSTSFYAHYFSYRHKDILDSSGSSTMPAISFGTLSRLKIIKPKTEKEQTAIATALSDVDALITGLESLIAKKQAIKTATMQQLLTGKTRLPQFAHHPDGTPKGTQQTELGEIPEDWNRCLMNDVIDFCSSGATPYRGNASFYKGTNRWITSGELNYCVINDTLEKISDDAVKKTNLKVHPAGTFLMAITGLEAAGTRGSCGIVGQPSTNNQSCMALYPNKKLDNNYLYHWYVYNGEDLAFKYCQGTKQLSYTAGLIRKIPIYLPSDINEQSAIAQILSDMDEEIQTLRTRLSKTQQIKQGMMQQLLTGKVRLI